LRFNDALRVLRITEPMAQIDPELPLDHRVEAADSTLVIGVTSRSNFPPCIAESQQI
jgi:hypothetical protein